MSIFIVTLRHRTTDTRGEKRYRRYPRSPVPVTCPVSRIVLLVSRKGSFPFPERGAIREMASDAEEFKVVLVGESGVGKTSFVIRYADRKFQNVFESTVGIDNKKVPVTLDDGTAVVLQIWDTAGQERFKSIVQRFYRAAQGAIVMYDVTDKASFEAVPWWLDSIRQTLTGIPIVLVGNKCDDGAQLEVIEELAQDFAEEERLYLFQASAKNDKNVKEVFESLATMMLSDRRRSQEPDERTTLFDSGNMAGARNIRLASQKDPANRGGCCGYLESPNKGNVV